MSQIAQAQAEYEQFPQEFSSIIISTVNKDGIPNSSYSPFIMDQNYNIYIYVSGLATHTQNLQVNPLASVLFIDDESKTKEVFARKRLSFDCRVILIEKESEEWQKIVDQFHDKFGEIIEILRSLPDFRIFQLKPYSGRFVKGFGAVYPVNSDNIRQLLEFNQESIV